MSESTGQAVNEDLKMGGGLVVTLGVLMIILGILAIGSPLVMTAVTVVWIGAGLLVSGVIESVGALKANGWRAGALAFVGGLLSVAAGGVLMARPMLGAGVFALLLTAYLLVDGLAKLVLGFKVKPLPGWGWTVFSGLVTLLLGILIWKQWPLSALWVVGTLVGINILFKGWAMVVLGSAVRQVASE